MALSFQTAVSDGTLAQLVLTIEYFDRSEITVYIDGAYVPSTAGRWSWQGDVAPIILLNPAVPINSVLTVRRTTSLLRPKNIYTAGAQFNPDTLDQNFLQVLHVAQEVQENASGGLTPTDTVRSFNARTGDVTLASFDIVSALGYTPASVGTGGEGLPSFSTGRVFAYQRAPSIPTGNPGDVVFNFNTGTIQSPASLANGWLKQIPDGAYPLWVTVATANATADTDSIGASEWTTPVILAQNGTNGLNVATVFLYQRTASTTPPGGPTGNVVYTFANGIASNMSNGWSAGVPVSDSSKPNLWVITATAAATDPADVILPAEWAAAQIMAQNGDDGDGSPGAPGDPGQRGTVNIAQCCYSSWSNTAATAAIASAGYGTPVNRDVVTLYNNSGFASTRYYQSGSWLTMAAYINGNLLVSGTVSAAAIDAGTLTGQVIQTNAGTTALRINEGDNNRLKVYAGGVVIADIGGTTSIGGAAAAGFSATSVSPVMVVANGSAGPAIVANNTGNGRGVSATVNNTFTIGAAVDATNTAAGGRAISISGLIATAGKTSGNGAGYFNEVLPVVNNGYSVGTPGFVWGSMYSQTAVNVTSDAREKVDVANTDLGLNFVNSLRPVKYRLREGNKVAVRDSEVIDGVEVPAEFESVPGTRLHYGFIAQEVQEALGDVDSGIWCLADKNDPESAQSLRYEELLSPLVRAVQELTARLEVIENK